MGKIVSFPALSIGSYCTIAVRIFDSDTRQICVVALDNEGQHEKWENGYGSTSACQ